MNKTEIRKLQKLLITARMQMGDMTIQRLNVLLQVYLSGQIDQQTLVKVAQLTPSSASKNVAGWTKWDAYKKPAPGFIRSTPDPMNLKSRVLELTDAGKAAVETLMRTGA